MAWESVIGQEHIKQMLQRAIVGGRVPQALLLSGEDGFGTLALATAFARVVNCERLQASEREVSSQEAGGVDACGECRSCKQSATLQHPNLTIVTALPSGKADVESELSPAVLEELKDAKLELARDPYMEFGLTGATQIRISQIRELKKSLSLSSVQDGRRVVILHGAETMGSGAANAFLKTLEEPHDNVTLILTTAAPDQLLQTIISRCQEIPVPPLDDALVVAALVEEGSCDKAEAELIVPFASGSLTRARAFLAEDLQTDRAEAVDLLRSALKGKNYRIDLASAAQRVAEGRDRKRAIRVISLLALWLRDARSMMLVGENADIANTDQREALSRFAENFNTVDMDAALDALELAVRDIRRNVTINTVLITTLLQVRRIFARTRQQARSNA